MSGCVLLVVSRKFVIVTLVPNYNIITSIDQVFHCQNKKKKKKIKKEKTEETQQRENQQA